MSLPCLLSSLARCLEFICTLCVDARGSEHCWRPEIHLLKFHASFYFLLKLSLLLRCILCHSRLILTYPRSLPLVQFVSGVAKQCFENQCQQMDAALAKIKQSFGTFLGRNMYKYTNLLKILGCYVDFHKIKLCIIFYLFFI
jgi:hypothetical protein